MKRKSICKILISILIFVSLVAGTLFAVGYFYYAKIIRNYLVETVSKESKGLYRVEIGDLSLNVLDGNLTIDRFLLQPDTANYQANSGKDTISPLLIRIRINQFRIDLSMN